MEQRLQTRQIPQQTDSIVGRWARQRLGAQLQLAGVTLDGPQLSDPQIRNERACVRMVMSGTLGAGESYVDGDWDCGALDVLTARLLTKMPTANALLPLTALRALAAVVTNPQRRGRAQRNVTFHYDIGDDLFAAMLGPTMTYSCGYWPAAENLGQAQSDKHMLICRKLGLQAGHRLLDIGCGWGEFLRFAVEHFDVTAVGITLSPMQAATAKQRCAGLPIQIELCDYRGLRGQFDRIASIGMFEHVGSLNYPGFFDAVSRLLTKDGLFLLHTIGRHEIGVTDSWIDRYVFPGGVLPEMSQIARAVRQRFVVEDWHNFGADYDRTLLAWYANVEEAWSSLSRRYDDRFRRMWRYYLLTCAGAFRARVNQLWQIVCSRAGVRGGYRRPSW